jgi:hypothetical protein
VADSSKESVRLRFPLQYLLIVEHLNHVIEQIAAAMIGHPLPSGRTLLRVANDAII